MNFKKLVFALGLLFLTACEKDKDEDGFDHYLDATITWTGSSADGCGYIISTGEQYPRLKPTNQSYIPDSYKTGEPIEVMLKIIDYKRQAVSCVWGRQYNEVKILDIKRKP